MSNQLVITSGAKVRSLNGVITGTTGVLDSLPINAANGIPQLDSSGKILVSQLPNSVMEYKGTWNAATNTPTLADGTGNQGDVYLCNVAGTVNFGSGPISFVVGDQVIYSGTIWQRASGATGTVTSVAVTESGDALSITGSPITTSGTINIGFAGTSSQYVAGDGSLITFPSLSGYIPYTGATSAIDLNAKTVVNIAHLGINTTSVPTILFRAIGDNNSTSRIAIRGYSSNANSSSIRVTKFRGTTGAPQAPQSGDSLGKFELAGYGTTSSEGYPQASFEGLATENWGATARGSKTVIKVTPNTTITQAVALTINQDKTAVFESSITGTSIIKTGGTSSQFLKADGSVDSSTYISLTALSATSPLSYNSGTGVFSISQASGSTNGYLSSADWTTFNNKQNALTNPITGTGTSGQVTYFNGTSSITSSANLAWDGTNLSIGNPSSPLAQLHVYNASAAATILLQTNSTTDYSEIAVRNNSSTATSYFRQYSTSTTGSDFGISRAGLALFFSNYATNFAIGTRNGGALIFGTADTERARIDTSGNFGIGTTSPSYKLDTYGTSGTTSLRVRDGNLTATAQILLECANTFSGTSQAFISGVGTNGGNNSIDLLFGTSSGGSSASERMRITSGGNVGIATSSPANFTGVGFTGPFLDIAGILQIKGTSANTLAAFQLGGDTYRKALIYTPVGTDTPYLGFGVATSGSSSGANEVMRITSGGNVLIGTSTNTGYKLEVNGDVKGGSFQALGTGAILATEARDLSLFYGFYAPNNSIMYFWNSVNGGVGTFARTTGIYTAISDVNKKKDFEDSTIGLNAILGLKPTLYRMKSDDTQGNKELGFIAQEVKEFIPQAFVESEDFIGLNYNAIVAALVKSVQELKAEINELKNK
jgi:hypothetical protein